MLGGFLFGKKFHSSLKNVLHVIQKYVIIISEGMISIPSSNKEGGWQGDLGDDTNATNSNRESGNSHHQLAKYQKKVKTPCAATQEVT